VVEYRVVETSSVCEEELTRILNETTREGWDFEGFQFAMRESATFPADVGALFFFTQVIGADPPTEISHVWIYGGKDVAVIPLAVEASSWRTWSRKKVPSDQPGVWTVEVRGPEGVVLLTATCKVE
jgi:hypothetical protein